MEFLVKGKVKDRVNNVSRPQKKDPNKHFSFDFIVVEVEHPGGHFQKPITSLIPVEVYNDNKTAPFRGDIEVGDVVQIWCGISCEAWKDYEVREFKQAGDHIQKTPSLFPKVILINVQGHIKGKVAENLNFDKSVAPMPTEQALPPTDGDLPF